MKMSKEQFRESVIAYIPEFKRKQEHEQALKNIAWKSKRRTKKVGSAVRLPKPESDDETSDFLAVLNNSD